MEQAVLDPQSAKESASGTWKAQRPLAKRVRNFGYFPNFEEVCQAGDLLLLSEIRPDYIGKWIRRVQETSGYEAIDARWEHAAVYVGEGLVCEADTTGGVQWSSVDQYIGGHLIRVRRITTKRDNGAVVDLGRDEGYRISIQALRQIGRGYNFLAAGRIGWYALWGQEGNQGAVSRPEELAAYICSRLFADAAARVTLVHYGVPPDRPATPASLSLDNKLRDVPLTWRKIV